MVTGEVEKCKTRYHTTRCILYKLKPLYHFLYAWPTITNAPIPFSDSDSANDYVLDAIYLMSVEDAHLVVPFVLLLMFKLNRVVLEVLTMKKISFKMQHKVRADR